MIDVCTYACEGCVDVVSLHMRNQERTTTAWPVVSNDSFEFALSEDRHDFEQTINKRMNGPFENEGNRCKKNWNF